MKREKTDNGVVTCVYCGQAYPKGTPTHGAEVGILTEHIKVCEKHPMRKLEEDKIKLRKALIALVGEEDPETLKAMAVAIVTFQIPAIEKSNTLDAIRAILET